MIAIVSDAIKNMSLYSICFLSISSVLVHLVWIAVMKFRNGHHHDSQLYKPHKSSETIDDSVIVPGQIRWQECTAIRHTRSGGIYWIYRMSSIH